MIKPNGGKVWGTHWTHRDDPVFEVNPDNMTEYSNGDRLPSIMFTEPILASEGGYDGRTYTMSYPYWDEQPPPSRIMATKAARTRSTTAAATTTRA